VLLVPNRAVTTLGTRKVVYVLNTGQVRPVGVTVGLASDTETQITSTNLKAGDVVVTNPTTITSATQTSTSIFASLFRALGVTRGGNTFTGRGGFGGGFGGGNFTGGGNTTGGGNFNRGGSGGGTNGGNNGGTNGGTTGGNGG